MAFGTRCARTIALAVHALALAALALPANALSFRTVAVTGDVAPGTGGATYETFLPAVLNGSNQVAFTATLTQGGAVDATNDLGMWSEGSGSLGLVEREGSAAPSGGSWGVAAAPPVINDSGQVAFRASTTSPSTFGVYSEGGGSLAGVAVSGGAAAGAPGLTYSSPFDLPSFNDAGQVAFGASLSGPGVTAANDDALWAGGTGSLAMAARAGDAAPGTADTWSSFGAPIINSGGDVAFAGSLGGGDDGIWAGPTSGVSLAVTQGTAAPGTGGGEFANFILGDYNDQGKIAIHAGLEIGVGGVTGGDDRVIFQGAPGSLTLVAREGDGAPGGGTFETFSGPLINDAGDVLFRGFLDTGTGLYLDEGGTLSKAVASGDTAPGTDGGLGDAIFTSFSDWGLADTGALAFEATLGGVGVTGGNDESLWLRDAGGTLEMIVREGMLWSIGLDSAKIVSAIDFYGDSDAFGRGINDAGAVVVGLTFSDGSEGVYVVTPEPGTAALLAFGLVAVAARRRGRR